MRSSIRSFAVPLVWTVALLCGSYRDIVAQKTITLEDIWQNGTFAAKGIPGFNFQKDGVHYTRLEAGRIEQLDLRTGQISGILFDAVKAPKTATGWKGTFDDYALSADESKILLTADSKKIYRWSSTGHYFVYNIAKNTLTPLYDGGPQSNANFSPDGSKVAFVVENDLYCRDLSTDKLTRITTDGKKNFIINGASDWVYEEEFTLVRAFEWSPDGERLAYFRFDESNVPEMVMELYDKDSAYPKLDTFKYPKVGAPNSKISAHVFDLKTNQTIVVSTEADPEDYLPRMAWTPAGELCITRMNRHQNHVWLRLANPVTGVCRTLLEETSKYYLDLQEPYFLKDGSGFVWQSPKNGFDQLYRYDMSGKETAQLTKGKYDVTALYGIDEKNDRLYYQAASVNAMQREIFSVNLKGKKQAQLSVEKGIHGAQFSSTYEYWVNSFSTINAPPKYVVRNRKGQIVRDLEQNQPLQQLQKDYGAVEAKFFTVPGPFTSEGGGNWEGLNGWMMQPAVIPEGTKLPVLMFVYGGPGSQQVLDQWRGNNSNYWWFQMLVQQGYIVVCVDNRGTGARGDEFKKMTYMQLGKYETADQISSANYLGTLPFVDKERIGIFGWSYGGYMSSLAMLKGKDVFEAAIAVAPVTNWKWYDSVYTERYMRTHAENKSGYEDNSPTNFAEQLQGQYLLVHGLADDNVHFQHTAEMANELIAHNKQFDTMIYPNRNHGISDKAAKMHLYTLMTNFLNEKLKGGGATAKP